MEYLTYILLATSLPHQQEKSWPINPLRPFSTSYLLKNTVNQELYQKHKCPNCLFRRIRKTLLASSVNISLHQSAVHLSLDHEPSSPLANIHYQPSVPSYRSYPSLRLWQCCTLNHLYRCSEFPSGLYIYCLLYSFYIRAQVSNPSFTILYLS